MIIQAVKNCITPRKNTKLPCYIASKLITEHDYIIHTCFALNTVQNLNFVSILIHTLKCSLILYKYVPWSAKQHALILSSGANGFCHSGTIAFLCWFFYGVCGYKNLKMWGRLDTFLTTTPRKQKKLGEVHSFSQCSTS